MNEIATNDDDISYIKLKSQGCAIITYENTNIVSVVDEKGLMYFLLINSDRSPFTHAPILASNTLPNNKTLFQSLSLIDTFQLSCNSEVWAIDSCPFQGENGSQEGDKNLSSFLVVAGSEDGFIYGLSVKFEICLKTSDNSKSGTPGSDNENFEIIVDVTTLWTQKAGDFITKVQIIDEEICNSEEINQNELNKNNQNKTYKKENMSIKKNSRSYKAIVSSMDKTIRCIDITNGNLLWGQVFLAGINTFFIHYNNPDSEFFNKNIVIAGATDGDLRIFNLDDGEIRFQTKLPANIRTFNIQNNKILTNSDSFNILCGCDDFSLYRVEIKKSEKQENKSKPKSVFPPSEIIKILKFPSYIWFSSEVNEKKHPMILFHTYSFDYLQGVLEKSETPQIPGIYAYELPISENQKFNWVIMDINTQCVTKVFNLYQDYDNIRNGNCMALGTPLGAVKLLILNETREPIIEEIVNLKGMINDINYHSYRHNKYILFTTDTAYLGMVEISNLYDKHAKLVTEI